jgi:hypothetical protein
MGQAATNIGAAAFKEGQRCFDVPLDTTMQNVRMPGGAKAEAPEKFYALGLGSGTPGLEAAIGHQKALPGSVNSASSTAALGTPLGTQGYPRHGDAASSMPMIGEQMAPARLPSQQATSFPHSEPFYEGPAVEGYVEEPPSDRDMEVDWNSQVYSQENLPTTPSLPLPNYTTQQSVSIPPPPPPPPRTNSTQQKPFQQASPPSNTPMQAPPPVAAQPTGNEEAQRNMWTQGSVLEIYSASSNRWYPALLLKVMKGDGTPDVLTMQFWLSTDEAKQKSLYRNDIQQLSLLGTHLGGELPPGFCIKPSASRPGHSVYLDQTTGMKYQTAELAWQTYFKRLLERPAAGMDTVCQLPGAQSMAVDRQPMQQMPSRQTAPSHQDSSPSTIAAGLTTEYEVEHSARGQQQTHHQQRRPEGPRMAPPQSTTNAANCTRVPIPTPDQLKASATTRHGAQLAAELNRLNPVQGNPEGPQVTDYRRAIRA